MSINRLWAKRLMRAESLILSRTEKIFKRVGRKTYQLSFCLLQYLKLSDIIHLSDTDCIR